MLGTYNPVQSYNRVLIIETCDECPHFDNEYFGYNEKCRRLNRNIEGCYNGIISNMIHKIPEDCPLEKS